MYGYPDADEDYSPPPTQDNDVYLGRVFAKKGSFTKWQVTLVRVSFTPFLLVCLMDKSSTMYVTRRDLSEMEEIYF